MDNNNGVIKGARKLNMRVKIPEEVNTMKRATATKEDCKPEPITRTFLF